MAGFREGPQSAGKREGLAEICESQIGKIGVLACHEVSAEN